MSISNLNFCVFEKYYKSQQYYFGRLHKWVEKSAFAYGFIWENGWKTPHNIENAY
jgi:hypothetical protein